MAGFLPPPQAQFGMPGGFPGMPPPQAAAGMQGFPDPGFSIQTGFEEFAIPSSIYGLMPYGAEGVLMGGIAVVVLVGVIVFIVGVVLALLGFGEFAAARSFTTRYSLNLETLADITETVLDAIDDFERKHSNKLK